MRLEIHDKLKDAQNITANRVVVYDDYNNPIAVVVEVEDNHYVAATATQKQFQNIISALGIDKTLVVTKIDANKLKQL